MSLTKPYFSMNGLETSLSGYWSMRSFHTPASLAGFSTVQTQLLHLNPAPKPALGLHVAQHVPDAAGGGVAEPVQRHPRRLQVVLRQREPLAHAVDHGGAARVHAEVVHAGLHADGEVVAGGGATACAAAVLLVLGGAAAREARGERGAGDAEQLREREHARREDAEVVDEGVHGGAGQLLAEVEARAAGVVLHLERAVVGLVGGAGVGAHDVAEAELGVVAEARVVGEEVGAAAGAEEAVAQHEGALVAGVPVGRDRLRRHHQRHLTRFQLVRKEKPWREGGTALHGPDGENAWQESHCSHYPYQYQREEFCGQPWPIGHA
ncbi:hypothetical protein U9M48_009441 [Paspalum notatum var. saurae]|uniref:Uncharacterized protein n=1 Tax=Paspalum notatum var. saurae TaxID=547442 RepID=A0AAQ3SSH7_PASNO